jgi:hypothetical protein
MAGGNFFILIAKWFGQGKLFGYGGMATLGKPWRKEDGQIKPF